MLAFHVCGDVRRGDEMAFLSEDIADDPFQGVGIAYARMTDDILEQDGREQVVEILQGSRFVERQVGLERETSLGDISTECRAFVDGADGLTVGVEELRERERIYVDGDVASGDVGGEIAGQHARVRTGPSAPMI